MTLKNYYFILGISPGTSIEGIRAAFRQKAKKFHPDRAGREQTAFFQDITEAYEVLSDPEKRKNYNNKLTKQESKECPIPVYKSSNKQERVIKPFASDSSHYSVYNKNFHKYSSGKNIHEENLSHQSAFLMENARTIEMDAYLTPQEACFGTTIRLNIDSNDRCPRCAGSGYDFLFDCFRCHGTGYTPIRKNFEINLPSNLNHDSQIRASLAISQENDLHLLIHVHII